MGGDGEQRNGPHITRRGLRCGGFRNPPRGCWLDYAATARRFVALAYAAILSLGRASQLYTGGRRRERCHVGVVAGEGDASGCLREDV